MWTDADQRQKLLGAAEHHLLIWTLAVGSQRDRVAESRPITDTEVESYLYVLALRNLLRVARLAATFDPQASEAAVQEFEATIPAAIHIRDVLEHFDEYEAGIGRLQENGAIHALASVSVQRRSTGTGWLLTVGPLTLDIDDATQAAQRLYGRLRAILIDAESEV